MSWLGWWAWSDHCTINKSFDFIWCLEVAETVLVQNFQNFGRFIIRLLAQRKWMKTARPRAGLIGSSSSTQLNVIRSGKCVDEKFWRSCRGSNALGLSVTAPNKLRRNNGSKSRYDLRREERERERACESDHMWGYRSRILLETEELSLMSQWNTVRSLLNRAPRAFSWVDGGHNGAAAIVPISCELIFKSENYFAPRLLMQIQIAKLPAKKSAALSQIKPDLALKCFLAPFLGHFLILQKKNNLSWNNSTHELVVTINPPVVENCVGLINGLSWQIKILQNVVVVGVSVEVGLKFSENILWVTSWF